jgi:TATA-box binding protein (TBP) (component of TFIID and TFIIIB)
MYEHLQISSEEGKGITFVEYGKKRESTVCKGFSKKFLVNRRREKPSKRFDNQLTIAYRVSEETLVNMKIFKNGNIQMTGVKNAGQGYDMVDTLIQIIKNIASSLPEDQKVVSDISQLKNNKYKICLINTDFKIGFEIKRSDLFKLMVADYENVCSYEPCIYPGVKIQYFWNSQNECKDGVCRCSEKCYFKKKSGDGHGDCNCKKITISAFQSGAVIITGSHTNVQIEECYSYITKLLYKNVEKIEKKNLINAGAQEA